MAKTTNPTIIEHNVQTGETIERPMTDYEYENIKEVEASQIAYEAKKKQRAADKAALLARLGLTEDELQTILG
jgi:hypothetical protein